MSKRIILHLSKADAIMAALIRAHGPYRLIAELESHPFQSLARAIAHQQLHATAANSILHRFIGSCGSGEFPTPQVVLATPEDALRAVGFSFAKIASLKDLATKTLAGIVPDKQMLLELSDAEIIERLTQVRGIGRWTVEMMLIFQLGRPDVLPVDDFGVRNGFRLAYGLKKMPSPRALALFGERWSPHRTAAAWYLWRVADLHRAGTLPVPLERVRMPRVTRRRKLRSAPKQTNQQPPKKRQSATKRQSMTKPQRATK
jgi:DNA-3-methyladenine glycosylase II